MSQPTQPSNPSQSLNRSVTSTHPSLTLQEWQETLFSEEWMNLLDKKAQRRFHDDVLAQEAATYVIEKITESNFARLHKFNGRSKPTTYLYSIMLNLFEEFHRKQFGRQRPPKWVSDQGSVWVTVWKMLSIERRSPSDIIDQFQRHNSEEIEPSQSTSTSSTSTEQLTTIIATLRARLPWCGHRHEEINITSLATTEEASDMLDIAGQDFSSAPDVELETLQYQAVLKSLATLLSETKPPQAGVNDLPELRENAYGLSNQQVMVLKMYFLDGITKTQICNMVKIHYRRFEVIFRESIDRIKEVFEEKGICAELLAGLE